MNVESISCRYAGLIPTLLLNLGFENLDMTAKDSEQVYEKVLIGRNDLVISDSEMGVIYYLEKLNYQKDALTRMPLLVFQSDLYIACSKDIPLEEVRLWQSALDLLKADRTYDRIYKSYF